METTLPQDVSMSPPPAPSSDPPLLTLSDDALDTLLVGVPSEVRIFLIKSKGWISLDCLWLDQEPHSKHVYCGQDKLHRRLPDTWRRNREILSRNGHKSRETKPLSPSHGPRIRSSDSSITRNWDQRQAFAVDCLQWWFSRILAPHAVRIRRSKQGGCGESLHCNNLHHHQEEKGESPASGGDDSGTMVV